MFNAPEVIMRIPDIRQIYETNALQAAEMEKSVDSLDSDVFLDSMGIDKISRWEGILGLSYQDNDTVEERRMRVKAKILEKLPHSYRVILRRLETLSPEGCALTVSHFHVAIKIALTSKKMLEDIRKMLEEILPLNMTYDADIMWNQYTTFATMRYEELTDMTYQQMREEVIK